MRWIRAVGVGALVVATAVGGAVPPLSAASPSSRPDVLKQSRDFPGLQGAVLSPFTGGGHLLVAQRDRSGTTAGGPVVAATVDRRGRWTPLLRLSSQPRVQAVAASAESAARATVAWKAGGRLWVRQRDARGRWAKQRPLGPMTGTGISVSSNAAGDAAITFRRGQRHLVLTKAATASTWHTWRVPGGLRSRPVTQVRAAGAARFSVAWLTGTGRKTSVRGTNLSPRGVPGAGFTVVARPHISAFSYAGRVDAAEAVVAVRSRYQPTTPDLAEDFGPWGPPRWTHQVSVHQGVPGSGPLPARITVPARGDRPDLLAVAVDRRAARVAYRSTGATGSDGTYFGTVRTLTRTGSGWQRDAGRNVSDLQGAVADRVLLDIAPDGASLFGVTSPLLLSGAGDPDTEFRVCASMRRVDCSAEGATVPAAATTSVSVGTRGHLAAAFDAGTRAKPVVAIRLVNRNVRW